MRARKCRKDQITGVGVARVNGQLIAVLGAATDFIDIGEIQTVGNALRVNVQGQGDRIDFVGTFTATKQAAFNAIRTRHDSEFRRERSRVFS